MVLLVGAALMAWLGLVAYIMSLPPAVGILIGLTLLVVCEFILHKEQHHG